MPDVTLTDAEMAEIEARGVSAIVKRKRYVVLTVQERDALIAALRASRERERCLADLIRNVGDKYDIYCVEVEAANLKEKPNRPPVIHARLELSEVIDEALAGIGDEEARAALGEEATS